jgi:hypothetical protein
MFVPPKLPQQLPQLTLGIQKKTLDAPALSLFNLADQPLNSRSKGQIADALLPLLHPHHLRLSGTVSLPLFLILSCATRATCMPY